MTVSYTHLDVYKRQGKISEVTLESDVIYYVEKGKDNKEQVLSLIHI